MSETMTAPANAKSVGKASTTTKKLKIIVPSKLDVLCGRGRVSSEHEGNKRFRRIVASHMQSYLNSSRKQKTVIVRTIIYEVVGRGGKFLKRINSKGSNGEKVEGWYDAGLRAGREKVGHALRDASQRRAKGMTDDEMYPSLPGEWNAAAAAAATAAADTNGAIMMNNQTSNNSNNNTQVAHHIPIEVVTQGPPRFVLPQATLVVPVTDLAAGRFVSPLAIAAGHIQQQIRGIQAPRMQTAAATSVSMASQTTIPTQIPIEIPAEISTPAPIQTKPQGNYKKASDLLLGPDVPCNAEGILHLEALCQSSLKQQQQQQQDEPAMVTPESSMGSQYTPFVQVPFLKRGECEDEEARHKHKKMKMVNDAVTLPEKVGLEDDVDSLSNSLSTLFSDKSDAGSISCKTDIFSDDEWEL